MRPVFLSCAIFSALLTLTACSASTKPPSDLPKLAFAPEEGPPMLRFGEGGIPIRPPLLSHGLAGRTIVVNRVSDIALRPGEVALTFDDGPMPGKTEAILNALDAAGVKATFLMVGQMARSYPAIARKVAARGHSIGTHTQNHSNLRSMSFEAARKQIDAGIESVSAALIPGLGRAAFFRFPYLADTVALRSHLAARGIIVMDVDIDSKDYFQSSPDQVRQRAMQRLARRGSGIILFHDIHQRTVAMLPSFPDELRRKGYSVVRLVPGGGGGIAMASLQD